MCFSNFASVVFEDPHLYQFRSNGSTRILGDAMVACVITKGGMCRRKRRVLVERIRSKAARPAGTCERCTT